jgi:hypothetical protein
MTDTISEANALLALHERSDPLLRTACYAGLTVYDLLQLGLSPLAFRCNSAWVPLLERMVATVPYVYEWVADEAWRDVEMTEPWQTCPGEVVLTKVG